MRDCYRKWENPLLPCAAAATDLPQKTADGQGPKEPTARATDITRPIDVPSFTHATMTDTCIRISDRVTAEANIGAICTYNTTEGREYGRILRATATEIVLDRLCLTPTGDFAPHPVPVCPRSRNRVTMSRDIRIVAERPAVAGWNLAEVAPSAPTGGLNIAEVAPVTDDKDRRIAELERKVALLTEAVTMFLAMKSATEHYAVTRAEEAIPNHRTHGFPVTPTCLPTGPSFQLCGWGTPSSTTTSRAEWYAAMEELQTATVKTDTLLASLTE